MDSSLLIGLSEPDRRALLAIARREEIPAGTAIFGAGDPADSAHLVVAGHVAVLLTAPDGETTLLRIIGPDTLVGVQALVTPGKRDATVVALDPVEALCIRTDEYDDVRARHPAVERVLTRALAAEVGRLSVLAGSLHLSPDQRILRRLLEAAAVFGTDAEPATVVPLTARDLAQLAGVPGTTVTRTLRAAAENAFLRVRDDAIEIYDAAAIAHQAR